MRFNSRTAVYWGFLSLLATYIQAGEIRGRVYSEVDGAPVPGTLVTLEQPPAANRKQNANSMGRFTFVNTPVGQVVIRGEIGGYNIAPEIITLTNGKPLPVELAAFPARHGVDDATLKWIRAEVERFRDTSLGYAAVSSKLARFEISPYRTTPIYEGFIKSDQNARSNELIHSYASINPVVAAETFEKMQRFVCDPAESLPPKVFTEVAAPIAVDLARSTAVYAVHSEKVKDSFKQALSKSYGKEYAELYTLQLAIPIVRYSQWKFTGKDSRETPLERVVFRGGQGYVMDQAGGRSELRNVNFFPYGGKLTIAGNWMASEIRWFLVQVASNGNEISGSWGRGAKIGDGMEVDKWNGTRVD